MYEEGLLLFLQWLVYAGASIFVALFLVEAVRVTEPLVVHETRYLLERGGVRIIKCGPNYQATVWVPWRASGLLLKLIISALLRGLRRAR